MAPHPTPVGLVFGGESGEHAVSIRSATTVLAAKTQGRRWLGIELDASYHQIAKQRLAEG